MSEQQPAEARAKAHDLVERAKKDAGYRERLKTDPIGTLQSAGLSLEEAQGLSDLRQDDVAGYMWCLPMGSMDCRATCDTITCLVTNCGDWGHTN